MSVPLFGQFYDVPFAAIAPDEATPPPAVNEPYIRAARPARRLKPHREQTTWEVGAIYLF
ncbi:MAG TPA: hypothetical protein V6D02_16130 [Candidatus Obscuribacterales bacterium]